MDRFTSERYAARRFEQDEDGAPMLPTPEPVECQSCGEYASDLAPATWDATMLICRRCEAIAEPECACVRTGDHEDARGCPVHGDLQHVSEAVAECPTLVEFLKEIALAGDEYIRRGKVA